MTRPSLLSGISEIFKLSIMLIHALAYWLRKNGLCPPNKEKITVWGKHKGFLPYTGKICEHTGKRVAVFTFEGYRYRISVPLDAHGNTDHCGQCLLSMTVHCARSGDPVFVGDRVTIITLKETRRSPKMTMVTREGKFLGFIAHPNKGDNYSPQGIWAPGRNGKGYFLPVEQAKIVPPLPTIEQID